MRFAPIILVYTSARVWKDIRVMALIVEVSNLLLFLQGNLFSSYLAGEAIRQKVNGALSMYKGQINSNSC